MPISILPSCDHFFENFTKALTVSSGKLAISYSKEQGFSVEQIERFGPSHIQELEKSLHEFSQIASKTEDLKQLNDCYIACKKVNEVAERTIERPPVSRKMRSRVSRISLNSIQEAWKQVGKRLFQKLQVTPVDFSCVLAPLDILYISAPEAAQKLIEAGVNVHTVDLTGRTPLMYACMHFKDSTATLEIVDKGVDTSARDRSGKTALMYALINGRVKVAERLFELEKNASNATKKLLLVYALEGGCETIARQLIEQGVDVKESGVLESAVTGKLEDLALELIEQGALINNNVFLEACGNGLFRLIRKLLEKGAIVSNEALERLLNDTPERDRAEVTRIALDMIAKGASLTEENEEGQTALLIACKNGLLDLAKIMVEKGASLAIKDEDGHTPLLELLLYDYDADENDSRNLEVLCNFFVEQGADVSVADKEGKTVLMHALEHGFEELSRKLIQQGASTQKPEVLKSAIRGGLEDLALELINEGAPVNSEHLLAACNKAHFRLIQKLLEKGVDVITQDEDGDTALHLLLYDIDSDDREQASKIALDLIERGVKIDTQNKAGVTPLIAACDNGLLDLAKRMVENGASLTVKDEAGETPLSTLLYYGCEDEEFDKKLEELCFFFIDRGADCTVTNKRKKTLLMRACEFENPKVAFKILEKNVAINQMDEDSDTALHYALAQSHEELSRELIKRGALIKDPGVIASAANGKLEKLALEFLDGGADYETKWGKTTALDQACKNGLQALATKLLDKKAPFTPSIALTYAALGMKEVARRILDQMQVVPSTQSIGDPHNPFEVAADIVKGVPLPSSELKNGRYATISGSPCSSAILANDEELAILIVAKSNQLLINDFLLACEKKMEKLARAYVERISNPKQFEGTPYSFFLGVCLAGFESLALEMIEKGFPLQDKSHSGSPAIFHALLHGMEKVVDALLQRGAQLSAPSELGCTITHAIFTGGLFKYLPQILKETGGRDLVSKSDEGKTPGQVIKKGAKLPGCHPVELAFLLQDLSFARAVALEMSREAFINEIEKVGKKYPKAPVEPFLFSVQYEMDLLHLEKGAIKIEIPKRSDGAAIEFDPKLAMLERKLKRRGFTKLTKDDYEIIENALYYVMKDLQKKPEIKNEVIKELEEVTGLCGPRLYNSAITLYKKVCRGVPQTYETAIFESLSEYREVLFRSLIPNGEQSTHDFNRLMLEMGKKYAIPNHELVERFKDGYLRSGDDDFDPKKAAERFSDLYNPWDLFNFLLPELHESTMRDKALDWHQKNVPAGKEFDFNDVVHIPETGGMQIKKEVTAASLVKLNVFKDLLQFRTTAPANDWCRIL